MQKCQCKSHLMKSTLMLTCLGWNVDRQLSHLQNLSERPIFIFVKLKHLFCGTKIEKIISLHILKYWLDVSFTQRKSDRFLCARAYSWPGLQPLGTSLPPASQSSNRAWALYLPGGNLESSVPALTAGDFLDPLTWPSPSQSMLELP